MINVINDIDLRINVLEILKRFELEMNLDLLNNDKLVEFIKNDKKRNNDIIELVILTDVEKFEFVPYTTNEIEELLTGGL